MIQHGGFLSLGGSPSHYWFTKMVIHDLDDLGVPPFEETPTMPPSPQIFSHLFTSATAVLGSNGKGHDIDGPWEADANPVPCNWGFFSPTQYPNEVIHLLTSFP